MTSHNNAVFNSIIEIPENKCSLSNQYLSKMNFK